MWNVIFLSCLNPKSLKLKCYKYFSYYFFAQTTNLQWHKWHRWWTKLNEIRDFLENWNLFYVYFPLKRILFMAQITNWHNFSRKSQYNIQFKKEGSQTTSISWNFHSVCIASNVSDNLLLCTSWTARRRNSIPVNFLL